MFNEGCRKGPNQPQISCLHSKFDVRPDRCRNIAISLVIGAPVLRSALTTPFILLMAVAGNLRKFGEPSQKKRQTAPKKICLRTWVGEADRARCTPPLTSRRGEARWSWRPRARPGGGSGEGGGEAVRPSVGAAGMVGESVGAWATGCGWLGGDGILLWPRCSALEPCGGSAHLLMWLGCARLSGTKC